MMAKNYLRLFLRLLLIVILLGCVGDLVFRYAERPEPSAEGIEFLISLTAAGYIWPLVGATYFLAAVLLAVPRTVGLGLVVLAPVWVNVAMFHLALDLSWPRVWPAVVVIALYLVLCVLYRQRFRSLVVCDGGR